MLAHLSHVLVPQIIVLILIKLCSTLSILILNILILESRILRIINLILGHHAAAFVGIFFRVCDGVLYWAWWRCLSKHSPLTLFQLLASNCSLIPFFFNYGLWLLLLNSASHTVNVDLLLLDDDNLRMSLLELDSLLVHFRLLKLLLSAHLTLTHLHATYLHAACLALLSQY